MRQVFHLEYHEAAAVVGGLGLLGRLIGPEEKFKRAPLLNVIVNGHLQITPEEIDRLAEAINFGDGSEEKAGPVAISLSLRETALVLAGLRCYQATHIGMSLSQGDNRIEALRQSILDIATDTGRNAEPDADEILALIDDLSPPDPAIVREHDDPGHDLAPGA